MAGGRTGRGSRRRTRAASAVVPFPQGAVGDRLDLARLVPSGRSLAVIALVAAGVLAAYWGARSSSVFAVERVEIVGAPPAVERQVRQATKGTAGRSLLEVDARAVGDSVRALPTVAGVAVDRAFPHTLLVTVTPKRPVAVVRRGHPAWLVTGAGHVIREIQPHAYRSLPRLWAPREVNVEVGARLPAELSAVTRALDAAQDVHLPHHVLGVRSNEGQLTLLLEAGPELRLGVPEHALLKLTVAARILPLLSDETLYLDVSVPERPVSSIYPNP
jgi:cell division septal protein FtsQ